MADMNVVVSLESIVIDLTMLSEPAEPRILDATMLQVAAESKHAAGIL